MVLGYGRGKVYKHKKDLFLRRRKMATKKFSFRNKIKADKAKRKASGVFIPDYLKIGETPLFVIKADKDKKPEDDVVEVTLDILPYSGKR